MRKTLLSCIGIVTITLAFAQAPLPKAFRKMVVIDTHNDFPTTSIEKKVSFDQNLKGITHSDLKRMQQGGVDVQIFSIFCDGDEPQPYQLANRQMDSVYEWSRRNPASMAMAFNLKQMNQTVRKNKLAAMMGVEGGHMIENDLSKLESLYKRGARYMTLTWNNSTSWATSAMDESSGKDLGRKKGLTDFGIEVVKKMNTLGMLVDLSHVGEQTFWDAINTTTKPILVSHSCAHALCPVFRNLKDDQIIAVGKNGGVIHLNFFSGFVDPEFMKRNKAFSAAHKAERDSLMNSGISDHFADVKLFEKYADEVKSLRPPLTMLIDHLDHIVKLVGVEHVGMGSDFDGINSSPRELEDVTCFPLIYDELIKRGYTKSAITKIMGGNFIRLMKANQVN
jgi:membrane dipeptidase